MGKDPVDFTTSANQDFSWKNPNFENAEKTKQMTQDLRSHHFEFGNEKPDYSTEAALNFKEKKPEHSNRKAENTYKTSIKFSG